MEETVKLLIDRGETIATMESCTGGGLANADYGVGITGRFGVIDPANLGGATDVVYVSIYDRQKNKDNVLIITSLDTERSKNKDYVIAVINRKISKILKKKNETKVLKRIKK